MFLTKERKFLEGLVLNEDPEDHFREFIIEFLKENRRLRQITDKVYF
jgi:hypothetical protein